MNGKISLYELSLKYFVYVHIHVFLIKGYSYNQEGTGNKWVVFFFFWGGDVVFLFGKLKWQFQNE